MADPNNGAGAGGVSEPMKNGGPAFPRVYAPLDHAISDGMSLLDYFAAAALMGCTAAERFMPAKGGYESPVDAAKAAYDYAQAMLDERERRMK